MYGDVCEGHQGMWNDLQTLWLKMPKLVNVFVLTISLRVSGVCVGGVGGCL